MKFTVERAVLIRMLEKARGGFRSKAYRDFGISLSACDARVSVDGGAVPDDEQWFSMVLASLAKTVAGGRHPATRRSSK